jgi:hypothetical protein
MKSNYFTTLQIYLDREFPGVEIQMHRDENRMSTVFTIGYGSYRIQKGYDDQMVMIVGGDVDIYIQDDLVKIARELYRQATFDPSDDSEYDEYKEWKMDNAGKKVFTQWKANKKWRK